MGVMVGLGVAVYTGIIERGWAATQLREDTPMTKTQTNTFQVTEDQLDAVSGGVAPGGCIVLPDVFRPYVPPMDPMDPMVTMNTRMSREPRVTKEPLLWRDPYCWNSHR